MKLDTKTRAKALEAGLWQRSNGTFIKVREMVDPYLINALLKALEDREPTSITSKLAAEVTRRGLTDKAMAMAKKRG